MTTKQCRRLELACAALGLIALLAWPLAPQAQELRAAFAPLCPTSKTDDRILESPALVAAILGSFSGKLVDAGIAAAKKEVSPDASTLEVSFLQDGLYSLVDLQKKDSADKPLYQTRFNSSKQCLVIAIGKFSDKAGNWNVPFPVHESKSASAHGNIVALLPLVEAPSLYFEAVVYPSNDKTAVTWKPVRLYVGQYVNDSFWAGRSRSLQLTFSMMKPGATQAYYSQILKFDHVEVPFHKTPEQFELSGAQGTWGALPPPTSTTPKIAADLGRGAPFDPFTLRVQVVEYPKPFKLAAAFVESIEANSSSIKNAVDLLVEPAKRQSAELSAESQTLVAVATYATSWKAAKEACAPGKLAEPTGRLTCQAARDALTIARDKVNIACGLASVQSCTSLELGVP